MAPEEVEKASTEEKPALVEADDKGVHALVVELAVDKTEADEIEDVLVAEQEYTSEEYKKLLSKIDSFLLPVLMVTYGLQYSDKVSLSSGVIFGLRKDTGLVGQQYAWLSTIFYLCYLIGEFPMGYAMQRLPLGKTIATTCVVWGGLVMLLAACNNFAQLMAVRALLGVFESIVSPGFLLIVASWYLRREHTLRSCSFFLMNALLGGIFSLIIYGIADKAQKDGHIQAWRVINLFLGAVTVADGIVLMFILGTPKEVIWLTANEKRMAHARIVSNGSGDGGRHPWVWSQVWECFRDPAFYFACAYNLFSTVPNGGLGTFGNLVYVSFGFTNLETLLYGLPSTFMGACWLVMVMLVVHKWPKTRFWWMAFSLVPPFFGLLSVGLLPTTTNKWTRYWLYNMTFSFACPTFLIWSMLPLNVAGRTKKTVMQTATFVFYCTGNMVGTQVFRTSDAPRYLKGLTVCAVCFGVEILIILGWKAWYEYANAKKEKAFKESGMSMEERENINKILGESDVTDLANPHFRYNC